MATKEAAERACKEPNPIIDGRKANVNLAFLGAKPRLNALPGKFCFSTPKPCQQHKKLQEGSRETRGGTLINI